MKLTKLIEHLEAAKADYQAKIPDSNPSVAGISEDQGDLLIELCDAIPAKDRNGIRKYGKSILYRFDLNGTQFW